MGKVTGFLDYERKSSEAEEPLKRIRHFHEFRTPLPLDEQSKQGGRCMACGVPFCQNGGMIGGMASGCPLHNLVPETNDLVYSGNWRQAYERLSKTHCFPEFTGRVCPALCEAACTCNLEGEPVAAKENEKAIIEHAFLSGWVAARPPRVRTGKKVAVIGSGPAGLAAAQQLNRRGHLVTVFERSDRIGGLLRYGIPNMKLEKEVLDRRLALMEAEGIVFKTNTDVGKNTSAEILKKEFDRIVLACGASEPRDICVPGRDSKHIYFAVDFLASVTKSLLDSGLEDGKYIQAKGKHVLIIGGGDTGNDCVGTVIRLGAESVTQLEMMPRPGIQRNKSNPWPQWPRVLKTDYGQEEAIAVYGSDPRIYETTVKEFRKDKNGNVKQAVLITLEAKQDEKTGKTNMLPIPGSEKAISADLVLIAAGFSGSQSYVTDAFKVKVDSRTNVWSEKGHYETTVPGIFAAGDMHRGQSLVVWAIKEGRECAKEVDKALIGYTNL